MDPTGVLGFSGSIPAAKHVISNLVADVSGTPLPPSAADIVTDIAQSARESFEKYPGRNDETLELMYVASDYGNITLVAENVIFAKNLLIKMVSPLFSPTVQGDAVRLGYARKYPMDILRSSRDNMLNYGLTEEGRRFQIGISIGSVAPSLAKYAPSQIGGLFAIGVDSVKGVGWWPYGPAEGLELVIENGEFAQVDHRDGRGVPLKSIIDFDPTKPDAGNLLFDTLLA